MQHAELHRRARRAQHRRHGDAAGRGGRRAQRGGGEKLAAAEWNLLVRHDRSPSWFSVAAQDPPVWLCCATCLRSKFCCRALPVRRDDRRPGFGIGGARAHEIDLEGVAVGPIERMQVLDAAAGLVVHDAHELDERRSGAHAERMRDVGRRQPGADALARVLDLHAGPLEQFEQRPRSELLAGEGHRNALGHVGGEIGERQAVDRAHAHRALQQLIRAQRQAPAPRAFRRHVVEGQQASTAVRRPMSARLASTPEMSAVIGAGDGR